MILRQGPGPLFVAILALVAVAGAALLRPPSRA
jgi:hypothetical protein